jgi:predicted transglutaminase-like cysteine proteinase
MVSLPHRLRGGLLAVLLLALFVQPRAWDADRMNAAAAKQGPRAAAAVRDVQLLLVSTQSAPETEQLQVVNQFFNRRVLFTDDTEVWNQNDHWASPLETLGQGRGDCEDYAIGKYFSLLALGMSSAKLRLVYVRAQIGGPGGPTQPHMVLAWYETPGAEPLILDNLIGDVRPASRRPDLVPVFSFNSDGLWQGAGTQSAGDPVARLSRWREVLAKARLEGWL